MNAIHWQMVCVAGGVSCRRLLSSQIDDSEIILA